MQYHLQTYEVQDFQPILTFNLCYGHMIKKKIIFGSLIVAKTI